MAKKQTQRRARATTATTTATSLIRSRSGYGVAAQCGSGDDVVTVTAPDGTMCLRIRLLADGPVIEVQSQSLHLVAKGQLRLDCQSLAVNAEREIALNASTIHQTAGGDIRVQAGGTFECDARAQRLRARLGDLDLEANDDVSLVGERILLNSPRALAPARRGRAPTAPPLDTEPPPGAPTPDSDW